MSSRSPTVFLVLEVLAAAVLLTFIVAAIILPAGAGSMVLAFLATGVGLAGALYGLAAIGRTVHETRQVAFRMNTRQLEDR